MLLLTSKPTTLPVADDAEAVCVWMYGMCHSLGNGDDNARLALVNQRSTAHGAGHVALKHAGVLDDDRLHFHVFHLLAFVLGVCDGALDELKHWEASLLG